MPFLPPVQSFPVRADVFINTSVADVLSAGCSNGQDELVFSFCSGRFFIYTSGNFLQYFPGLLKHQLPNECGELFALVARERFDQRVFVSVKPEG